MGMVEFKVNYPARGAPMQAVWHLAVQDGSLVGWATNSMGNTAEMNLDPVQKALDRVDIDMATERFASVQLPVASAEASLEEEEEELDFGGAMFMLLPTSGRSGYNSLPAPAGAPPPSGSAWDKQALVAMLTRETELRLSNA